MKLFAATLAAFAASGALAMTGAVATRAAATGDMDAILGKALFERDWIPGTASTRSADGLGPLFSARSCTGCHAGDTLGARFTEIDGKVAGRGIVVRFADAEGRPDPRYGTLLQTQGTAGVQPEGRVVLAATGGGALQAALHLERGPLDDGMRTSFRLAPPLVSRGAIEAIDAAAILALADPDDRDGDGISGRPRILADGTLGRYGWKAGSPTLDDQIADAFAREMGLSSAHRPLPYGDCTSLQQDCLGAPNGAGAIVAATNAGAAAGHELSDEMTGLVAAFVRSLPQDPARAGEPPAAFAAAGCAACHVPALPTLTGGSAAIFSDLLLHDLGASLDDGAGEPGSGSAEWRTAPLVALHGKGRRYLHDGRAGTLDAAIRAHGGEAAAAQAAYLSLPDAERDALLAYLETL
jgi:CxxC motif-containing protein (DUF1111 family)